MDEENSIPASAAESLTKQTFFSEYRNLIVAAGLLITISLVFLINALVSGKQIVIAKPDKAITLKAGETYTIVWASKGIASVGIALFNDEQGQWIAKGVSPKKGKYEWTVLQNQKSGSNYRLVVFEYPWKKGNVITYTKEAIQIIGPQFVSCSGLSVSSEWPFLPGNYPNLKRIFFTESEWNGNLGGLDGADAKCQAQADSKGYKGKFIAFLGTDKTSAKERVAQNSIFVLAYSAASLPEGQNCYRLVGRDADLLLNKAILASNLINVELDNDFARLANGVWYGRRTPSSKTECLALAGMGATGAFSGTFTCADWTQGKGQIYQGTVPPDADLVRCYDQQGKTAFANYFAANAGVLSIDGALIVVGSPCDRYNRLLCIEQ
jgi:hypothetical protein